MSDCSESHIQDPSLLPQKLRPSLTPLDCTQIPVCSTNNNPGCLLVTSIPTNTSSQSIVSISVSQVPVPNNSSFLGTPKSAGTPKTPSPRLRSLLSMAGYSAQDIEDAAKSTNKAQPHEAGSQSPTTNSTANENNAMACPSLPPATVTSAAQPNTTNNNMLSPLAYGHLVQVWFDTNDYLLNNVCFVECFS